MRGWASLGVLSLLGGTVWAALSLGTSEARVDPAPVDLPAYVEPEQIDQPPSEAEQRTHLNQRLNAMIKEGKGARLTDAPSRRITRTGTSYRPAKLDLTTAPNIPDNDLDCLTQAIYYEARNESEAGQIAVAEVVMNRVRHPSYPNRVCDVVYQRNSRTCQFTFTCDGSIGRSPLRQAAWSRARSIASDVLDGRHQAQLPDHSVNYHANYVRPTWGQRLARVRQIGAHIFYGGPNGRAAGAVTDNDAPRDQA